MRLPLIRRRTTATSLLLPLAGLARWVEAVPAKGFAREEFSVCVAHGAWPTPGRTTS